MIPKKTLPLLGAALLLSAPLSRAQLPSETLLLVNQNAPLSLKLANHYAEVRGIPRRNLIHLDLPAEYAEGALHMTPEAFTEHVWTPARQAISERGLEATELAWVYSSGFPVRIDTTPAVSITGLTFARNQLPAGDLIKQGLAITPLFAGPGQGTNAPPARPSFSFSRMKEGLTDRMPLPAMLLAWTGERGLTEAEAMAVIQRGVQADRTRPQSGIWFVKTTDPLRSLPREWEYTPVQLELAQRSIEASTVTNLPVGKGPIIGLLTGAVKVNMDGLEFAPGAFAECMTSFGAVFSEGSHTKCTDWLKAGATASSGTVVEPYNPWTKFPHARFFTHYISGCTLMESFYQSVASPFQQLPVGEPLARPCALPIRLQVDGLSREPLTTPITLTAQTALPVQNIPVHYEFRIDGKTVQPLSPSARLQIDPALLNDGFHELTIIARTALTVDHAVEVSGGFIVARQGRSIRITGLGDQDGQISATAEYTGDQAPEKILLLSGARELDRQAYQSGSLTLICTETTLGEGPNRLQAVAEFADGTRVFSTPVPFAIQFKANKPEPSATDES